MPELTIQQAYDLALHHHHGGRVGEAEQIYRQILGQEPRHVDSMHHLGVAAHQMGRSDAAADLIRAAIALRPDFPEAWNNLGIILKEMDQAEEAIAAYQRAISLRPDFPEAQYNLGIALQDAGQLNGAIAAYRKAIGLRPDYHDACNALGAALQRNGELDDAMDAYRHAIGLRPDFAEARSNLGMALKDAGQFDEAIAEFRRCIAIKPHFPGAHSNLILALHFHPANDAASIAEELRNWNRQYALPLEKFIRPHGNDRNRERRLKIGYVSPDFRNHVVGRNLLPLFRQHDHRQFEIFCYTQTRSEDAMTREFQRCADVWRKTAALSEEKTADLIREDQIDILVDLALHTADNRLLIFARKPAPVQVTFAGYPGSTGLSAMDYRLSDPYLDPPGMDESIYSERTIRLPDSFWCYDPLDCRDIPVNSLPAMQSGIVTFACLNNFCKINDEIVAPWAQILARVDRSRLLLLAKEGNHRRRTLDRFSREGIDPGRIEFASIQPRKKYMELYHLIDIGLDSFPYNGHTTSLDSFWMGVPVVTLVGDRAISRAGWCQLSNLGLTELAGRDAGEFVQIAANLARDLPRLAKLRSTLRQRMEQSPLMDACKFARSIEAAYRQTWRQWCESLSMAD